MNTSQPPLLPSMRPAAACRWWAALAVVALLWAQGLGVWHHTLHAPGLASAAGAARAAWAAAEAFGTGAAPPATSAAAPASPLHHAPGSVDCRLLDLLLLADGVAAPLGAVVLPAAAAVRVVCPALAQRSLPAAPPYLARAPPRPS